MLHDNTYLPTKRSWLKSINNALAERRQSSRELGKPIEISNSIGMKLGLIPARTSWMGQKTTQTINGGCLRMDIPDFGGKPLIDYLRFIIDYFFIFFAPISLAFQVCFAGRL